VHSLRTSLLLTSISHEVIRREIRVALQWRGKADERRCKPVWLKKSAGLRKPFAQDADSDACHPSRLTSNPPPYIGP